MILGSGAAQPQEAVVKAQAPAEPQEHASVHTQPEAGLIPGSQRLQVWFSTVEGLNQQLWLVDFRRVT